MKIHIDYKSMRRKLTTETFIIESKLIHDFSSCKNIRFLNIRCYIESFFEVIDLKILDLDSQSVSVV